MVPLLSAWITGGKTNTALLIMIALYLLNHFGISTTETQITEAVAVVLGVVGQLHKLYKSDLVQNIVSKFKKKEVPNG